MHSELGLVAMPTRHFGVSLGGFPEAWCLHVCVGGAWVGGPVNTFLTKSSEMVQGKEDLGWRTFMQGDIYALCRVSDLGGRCEQWG